MMPSFSSHSHGGLCLLLLVALGATAFIPQAPHQFTRVLKPLPVTTARHKSIVSMVRRSPAPTEEASPQRGPLDSLLINLGYKSENPDEDRTRTLKDKIKSAGAAGVLSYVSSEVLFWFISLPIGLLVLRNTTGEWPDLSSSDGQAKLAAFSATFLAFARAALPVRAAVAVALTPAVEKYIVLPLQSRGIIKPQESAE